MEESDMRWLWAAYKMGAWEGQIYAGLDEELFTEDIICKIKNADFAWTVECTSERGLQPSGIIVGTSFGRGRCVEPHMDWFPWATPRNRLEGMACFLRTVGRQLKIFAFIDQENLPFYERIYEYRLLTRGCKVLDHYGPGEHAIMFYTMGP